MRDLTLRHFLLFFCLSLSLSALGQGNDYLAYWNFNNTAQLTTPTLATTGANITSSLFTGSEIISGTGQNFNAVNALNADIAGSHLRLNLPIGSVLYFNVPTVGYSEIVARYETRRSGMGAGVQYISYSTDGTTFVPLDTVVVLDDTPPVVTLDFSEIEAVNENSNFRIRIEFAAGGGGVEGNNRFDNFTVAGINANPPVDPGVALSFPVSGATQTVLRPTFRWLADAGPYTLQVSTTSSFASLLVNVQDINSTQYKHSSNLQANTVYYWRVGTAVNGSTAFSSTFSFRTHQTGATGQITYFALAAQNNSGKILETIVCDISTDNSIVGVIPGGISNFDLVPTFVSAGVDSVVVNGRASESQWTQANFASPVTYSLYSGGASIRQYVVSLVHTNLPVVYVNTLNAAPILNRDNYVAGTVRVIKSDGSVEIMAGTEIRGRGNSTWGMPKKPYRIRLNNATSIFGFPAERNWVLLANYSDKTLVRNRLAFNTSELMGLSYNPHSTPVELVLNGLYQGSYLFGDHVKVADGRVDITEMSASDDSGDNLTGGYFLELDERLDEVLWFRTARNLPFTIKEPEEATPNQQNYIKAYMQEVENVLFSPSFSDPVNGYAKYIDVESFIKWYWVNEIFKNNDARDFSSIFYYKDRNEKLKMGPVWDFDIAAGNINYNNSNVTTGWYIRNSLWFSRLFQDPAFVLAANRFWNERRNIILATLNSKIDQYTSEVGTSQQQNFRRWPILGTYVWPNAVVTGSYAGEVNYLKTWLQDRINWINSQIDPNAPGKITPAIAWPSPAPMRVGTPLSNVQLNAVANVNGIGVQGEYAYTPSAGTILPVGLDQPLYVTFTPSDTATYRSEVSASTTITVIDSLTQFYRGINLNGPATVIDGNSWAGSSSAAGFSSTNAGLFSNPSVTLTPAADAEKATMIRSSLWGSNIGLAVSGIPSGNYHVYLYVWEDNFATTYTVRVEGVVVQPNFNSGTAGRWTKLGPYATNITDGTLNISATGGDANLSGIEIWSIGNLPTLTSPLVDQVATAGAAFTYSFLANSFSGSGLSYTATLAGGGSLPSWLTFTPSTRTFSGTPAAADIGTLPIKVTATNAAGSVSDEFILAVNAAPTPPVLDVTLQDQTVNAGSALTYVIPANSFSGSGLAYTATRADGSSLPSWLTFTSATRTFSGIPSSLDAGSISIRVTATNAAGSANDVFDITVNSTGAATFYRGINLNGPATVIDGNSWAGSSSAPGFSSTNSGVFSNQSVALTPSTDANRATMIRSSLWGSNIGLAVSGIPSGNYHVYLYVWEDNFATTFTVRVEGVIVQPNFNSGTAGRWTKLGPYAANITDGTLNISATGGDANLSGIEIWSAGALPPALATPLVDQVAIAGSAFTYSFPANSFSGSGITYSATLSNGGSLPSWLTFTPSTRTFSGTPAAENTGTLSIRVTALNSAGPASDEFTLTVNAAPTSPVLDVPLQDQNVNAGSALTYVIPANSFSGSGLAYTATRADGSSLPSWLTFTSATRTFSGIPSSLDAGSISIRVTATNAAGSANDVFDITVNSTGAATFYRGINLNGPATVIDGNSWAGSSSAPGFSSTNSGVFSNQSVALTPSTDANRATMIRSSMWGSNISLAVSGIPSGNYHVYLYVWEDNFATTFTVRVEGVIVQPNFNSGTAGRWTKLGPYATNITDGTLNISATGGDANLSGIEIWSAGALPPALATPLVDQVAIAGSAFTYSFPANSFSGSGITYSATLSDGGSLPSWLTFTPSTRTFSGTPAAADIGTLSISVTASNAAGSGNDQFDIRINEPSQYSFYRAVNLNGPSISIDGHTWDASSTAVGFSTTNAGSFSNQNVSLIPATDANRATMIRSSLWGRNIGLALGSMPNSSYQVYLYVWEDNATETYTISMEGAVVRPNYASGAAGRWEKLGPFDLTVTDGTLNVLVQGGDANLSGLEVWRQNDTDIGGSGAGRLAVSESTQSSVNEEAVTLSAYPNPFADIVNIEFTVERPGLTTLSILDSRGVLLHQEVVSSSYVNEKHHMSIDSKGMTPGVYIIRLTSHGYVRYARATLMR